MDSQDWKKFKRSGGYRRKVQKVYENMVHNTPTTSASLMVQSDQGDNNKSPNGSVEVFMEDDNKEQEISYITSNVHNLSHLVDEVKRFGTLHNFNAYPFENKLQIIKHMLRQGNKPLAQVARRLHERNEVEIDTYSKNKLKYPFVRQCSRRNGSTLILKFENFILSSQKQDKWFLTTDKSVVEIRSIHLNA